MVLLATAMGIHMINNPDEPISIENAMEKSKDLNVKCFEIRDPMPDIKIHVLGSKITEVCGKPVLGCYANNNIYLWDEPEKDRPVYEHEFLHAVCLPGSHYFQEDKFHALKGMLK